MSRETINRRNRERYANDPSYRETVLERQRTYSKTQVGREAKNERKRRWKKQNREAWLAQCRRQNEKRAQDPVARAEAARRTSAWYRANRSKALAWRLGKYGLTLSEYVALLRSQRNRCAICNQHEVGRRPSGKRRHLAVDHDHVTGIVRALLCSRCNLTIGRMEESPVLLRAAADYIERFSEEASACRS